MPNVSYFYYIKSTANEYMSLLDACAYLFVVLETSLKQRLKTNIKYRDCGLILPIADIFILPNGKKLIARLD